MKNSTGTTAIMNKLDQELKALLKEDLKRFRTNQSKNNQDTLKQLMAA
ncbi:MAG TPA: hypothetical protein VHC47_05405 [Mucilaginibacter sp.]|nr:hypothetical protein [Mucilaginibacter sp.]